MIGWLRRLGFVQRQRGQVIGLAVGVMVAMLAATALVVDAGLFLVARRELAAAADAAALAGVQNLKPIYPSNPAGGIDPDSITAADAAAVALTDINTDADDSGAGRICNATPNLVVEEGTKTLAGGGVVLTYTATLDCVAGYTAGRVLGLVNMPIRVSATAVKGAALEAKCPLPVFIIDADHNIENGVTVQNSSGGNVPLPIDAPVILWTKKTADGSLNGNWGGVDVGSGANALEEAFAGTTCFPSEVSIGEESKTGMNEGKLKQGIQERRNSNGTLAFQTVGNGANQVISCIQNYATVAPGGVLAVYGSGCVGNILVVWTTGSGSLDLDVLGIATVFIDNYKEKDPNNANAKTLNGYYISASVAGDVGGYNPTGTISTRLIR